MAEVQKSPDSKNPARALNRVSKLVTRYFDRKLAGAGINVAYLAILGPLSSTSDMSQKVLAASAGSSQAAVAELLARMVDDELLSKRKDPSDKRQTLFSLTPKGMAVMPAVMSVIEQGNSELFDRIGDDGVRQLLMLLAQIEARLA